MFYKMKAVLFFLHFILRNIRLTYKSEPDICILSLPCCNSLKIGTLE